MKLIFQTATASPPDMLSKRIEFFDFPAILLGEDLKIIAKNQKASRIFKKLRKGGDFRGFMESGDTVSVSELKNGSLVTVTLNDYEATVFGGIGCRLIIIGSVDNDVRSRLDDIYQKASGYDVYIPRHSSAPSLHNEMDSLMTELLNGIQKEKYGNFNLSAVIGAILRQLRIQNPKLSKRISLEGSLRTLFVNGSEYDFGLVFTYLLYLCLEKDPHSKITVTAHSQNQRADVIITSTAAVEFDFFGESVPDENGYWSHLVRLISYGNLWKIDTLSNRQRTVLTLSLPLTHPEINCDLRDADLLTIGRFLDFFFQKTKQR